MGVHFNFAFSIIKRSTPCSRCCNTEFTCCTATSLSQWKETIHIDMFKIIYAMPLTTYLPMKVCMFPKGKLKNSSIYRTVFTFFSSLLRVKSVLFRSLPHYEYSNSKTKVVKTKKARPSFRLQDGKNKKKNALR